jgi:hypothetical protein
MAFRTERWQTHLDQPGNATPHGRTAGQCACHILQVDDMPTEGASLRCRAPLQPERGQV